MRDGSRVILGVYVNDILAAHNKDPSSSILAWCMSAFCGVLVLCLDPRPRC